LYLGGGSVGVVVELDEAVEAVDSADAVEAVENVDVSLPRRETG
jgi:proteasome assembly chaperone (PAC2) family protein